MNVIRRNLASCALVVACAALIVAIGGVSYAASVLPKNSVGTAQLQKKAVTAAKLKRNAVTSAKVKNGSLLAGDFKAGQLPQGPKGDAGPKGDTGAKGETGAKGDAATKLFATIDPSGSLTHGSGVIESTKVFTGRYTVTFDRSMDGCVATAGFYRENLATGYNPANHFWVSRTPNPNQVEVGTYNSSLNTPVNVPFTVIAFC